jgi:hypothetical protein
MQVVSILDHVFLHQTYLRRRAIIQRLFATQLLLDIGLEVFRLLGARPPALDLSVLANQELLKVPLDALEAHEAGLLVLEPFEGGVCLCAVDLSQNK